MNPATHRAQLVGLLAEAAEIEHCLMCTYLYAAFSLKRSADEDLQPDELDAVQRWRSEIIAIATDEMLHLALVNNLSIAVGARPHYRRFNFPINSGVFPADIAVELAPLTEETLDHFVYLERPADVAERDGAHYLKGRYRRRPVAGRLMQVPEDYTTVGELYEAIEASCDLIALHIGEDKLFIGPRASQLAPKDFRLPGLITIGTLAQAREAVDFIRFQGEGSRDEKAGSHYARFRAIRSEWEKLLHARPGFTPARPAARNPVMRDPVEAEARVHVVAEPAATLLDAGNVCYETMLRLLTALSDVVPSSPAATARRRAICDQTLALMHTLADVGSLLSALPANEAHPGVNAGLTFTASRTVLAFLSAETATLLMAERFGCVADRFEQLSSQLPTLARHAKLMKAFSAHWTQEHDQRWPAANRAGAASTSGDGAPSKGESGGVAASASTSQASFASASASSGLHASSANASSTIDRQSMHPASSNAIRMTHKPPDVAIGRDVVLRFDTQRCIHSRQCVLGEPMVFLANTPGEWLFPDAATPERIAIVAAACPSGAVTYERKDGGPNEAAPAVNVIRVRENGPLAVVAELDITGHAHGDASAFRATLCRCGQSMNKPFCDGSHNTAAFRASGEPATRESQALAVRNGPLEVTPTLNGPYQVTGNLEICSGTGRTVDRLTVAYLCRCGNSQDKPFCDGSHARVGFVAEGA